MLKFNFIPRACWTLGYKWEVNLGSRFEIIDTGTPCNLTTLFTYNFANLSTESIIFIDKKSIYLVNRSTMTQTSSLPPFPLGNPTQSLWWYFLTSIQVSAGHILNHFFHTKPVAAKATLVSGVWCLYSTISLILSHIPSSVAAKAPLVSGVPLSLVDTLHTWPHTQPLLSSYLATSKVLLNPSSS